MCDNTGKNKEAAIDFSIDFDLVMSDATNYYRTVVGLEKLAPSMAKGDGFSDGKLSWNVGSCCASEKNGGND